MGESPSITWSLDNRCLVEVQASSSMWQLQKHQGGNKDMGSVQIGRLFNTALKSLKSLSLRALGSYWETWSKRVTWRSLVLRKTPQMSMWSRGGRAKPRARLKYLRWQPSQCPGNHSVWHLNPFPFRKYLLNFHSMKDPVPMAGTETPVPTSIYSVLRTLHSLLQHTFQSLPQHSPGGTLGSSQMDWGDFPSGMSSNYIFFSCPYSCCGNLRAQVWNSPFLLTSSVSPKTHLTFLSMHSSRGVI